MKKYLVLIITLHIAIGITRGQATGIGLHKSQIVYYPFNIEQQETLDSSRIVTLYEHSYCDQDIKEGSIRVNDIMALQIGNKLNKFYSQNLHQLDRKKTFGDETTVKFRQNYIGYEIYTNKANQRITVVNREPFETEKALVYEEPMPSIQWRIDTATDTILGYTCQKATAHFLGRTWAVWYTPQIPISSGPWKLQGLPGLILQASDTEGIFQFTAIEIKRGAEAICRSKWHEQRISKDAWMKYEKGIHEQPYIYLSKGGQIEIFNIHTDQVLTDSWSIPYTPIEK